MRQTNGIRCLWVVMLVLFLAGCSETYAYLPSVGSKPAESPPPGAAAPEAAAQPAPAAEAPAPKPDLAQQVQSLEARVQQMENRLAQMETRPSAPGAAAVKAKERPSATPSAAPAPAASGDKVYAEGFRLYQAKKFAPARTKFSQYLKEQPKGPKAPEARYHLADSFYQEGKYQEAAVEFNKLASQSPKSILAPAAMLRQALSYQNLHQTASYRSTLNKLVQAYPKSPEAKEAEKWLKEGKKEAPAKAPTKTLPKPE
jgi:tol-pal system protein YbgF